MIYKTIQDMTDGDNTTPLTLARFVEICDNYYVDAISNPIFDTLYLQKFCTMLWYVDEYVSFWIGDDDSQPTTAMQSYVKIFHESLFSRQTEKTLLTNVNNIITAIDWTNGMELATNLSEIAQTPTTKQAAYTILDYVSTQQRGKSSVSPFALAIQFQNQVIKELNNMIIQDSKYLFKRTAN